MSFTSKTFDKQYYEEHKAAGLDYLSYGYWQESYTRMVTEACLMTAIEAPTVLDLGCACGALVEGFRRTKVYAACHGIDVNAHAIGLGRERFGVMGAELMVGSGHRLPFEDDSLTLIHCAQVFEHIPHYRKPDNVYEVVEECVRVLQPGGVLFACLDAVKHGQTEDMYKGDPTHCTILPMLDWDFIFTHNVRLKFWCEGFERFARHPARPDVNRSANFFQAYPNWSVWVMRKV